MRKGDNGKYRTGWMLNQVQGETRRRRKRIESKRRRADDAVELIKVRYVDAGELPPMPYDLD